MTEKLTGGYVNEVYRSDGYVSKFFTGENLVGVAGDIRAKREKYALSRFGGDIAPKLFGFTENHVDQEFIAGKSLETEVFDLGNLAFYLSGKLLREIHQPVKSSFDYFIHKHTQKTKSSLSKASPILETEELEISLNVDWDMVRSAGITRVHRDFWFGNILNSNGHLKAIDWEFAGIGSPYEDFAIVEMWIFREYEKQFPLSRECFWEGYGKRPSEKVILEFLKARCVEILATTDLHLYMSENKGDFYHNKVDLLKKIA